jgi:hypothetical protein
MWHAYGNANSDANLHSDGDCDSNLHSHSDGDCDGNSHIHADGDSNSDLYSHGNGNGYNYGYGNRHGYSHSNGERITAAFTDATASPDTGAETVTPLWRLCISLGTRERTSRVPAMPAEHLCDTRSSQKARRFAGSNRASLDLDDGDSGTHSRLRS